MEGGGQILRIATALGCLLHRPVSITNIRAGRQNPGLRPQHLSGIELVKKICHGALLGGSQGATSITLHPGVIKGGEYEADTKTAGNTALLLQVALPCLLFADKQSTLVLKGGTDCEMAPPIDYFNQVLKVCCSKVWCKLRLRCYKKGLLSERWGRGVCEGSANQGNSDI